MAFFVSPLPNGMVYLSLTETLCLLYINSDVDCLQLPCAGKTLESLKTKKKNVKAIIKYK